MKPKVLVIGGMHGNERLGIDLVKRLQAQPIEGVSVLIANPKAVKANQRFTETDLNRSFADKDRSYETRRANFLKRYVRDFNIVLDFHNTQTPNNNCGFVGVGCSPFLFKTLKLLGMTDCIEATYDCINKYCLNVVSVEISIGDKLDDVEYWYSILKDFNLMQSAKQSQLNIYRFQDRVTWQQKKELGIANWEPFKPISKQLQNKLNLDGIIVPIFIGSKLTPYYATVLSKERTA